VTETSATLNAMVNPNGGAVTDCHFEYGTTTSYGTSVPCASLPGSEGSPVAVSAAVTGLNASTTYHFRISATNAGGTERGGDETFFTTIPPSPTVTKVEPNVGPATGGTSVTITGTNFTGATTVKFGSTNATSFTANSQTSITAVSPAGGAGTVDVTVTTPGGTSETGAPDKFSYQPNPFNAHYFSNGGQLKESEGKVGEAGVKEVIGWGTIELKGEKGGDLGTFIRCHNIIGGMVWNPVGGGAGKGTTRAFAVFDCETNLCVAGTVANVVPEELPWVSELQETGLIRTNKIRSHTEHLKLDVTCNGLSTAHFQGSYQPAPQADQNKGTSALHPGFVEFDQPGSGELEEVELGGSSAPRGVVKEFGYAEEEMIQVK
jgi:hypothetical protein